MKQSQAGLQESACTDRGALPTEANLKTDHAKCVVVVRATDKDLNSFLAFMVFQMIAMLVG